jgi:hypothetical protein
MGSHSAPVCGRIGVLVLNRVEEAGRENGERSLGEGKVKIEGLSHRRNPPFLVLSNCKT